MGLCAKHLNRSPDPSRCHVLIADPAEKPHLRHNAVCLETQHFPDAVNHEDWAGSVLLEPGGTYLERAKHVFSADR